MIARAIGRAGKNPHLKGHIHEVLTQDSRNLGNLFKGQTTRLPQSTTAKAVDLVTTRGGKVVERLQLKDTLSPASVNKLVRQVADGKYRSTQLVGTKETTKLANAALEKAGLSKRMISSGHSSQTTTSFAQCAGAAGAGTLSGAVIQAAKTGGAAARTFLKHIEAGVPVIVSPALNIENPAIDFLTIASRRHGGRRRGRSGGLKPPAEWRRARCSITRASSNFPRIQTSPRRLFCWVRRASRSSSDLSRLNASSTFHRF